MFDTKFTFIDHINYIIPKEYAMYGFVKRNYTQFKDPYTKLSLFSSFIRSRLEYASFVWSATGIAHINSIERAQKKILPFALLSLNFNDPVPSYSAKCRLVHLSSLQDRRTTSALVFICDLLSSKIDCPALLSSISFSVPGRSLTSFEPFFIPAYRANYTFNEPLCRALFYWNKLPSHSSSFGIVFLFLIGFALPFAGYYCNQSYFQSKIISKIYFWTLGPTHMISLRLLLLLLIL